MNTSQTLLSSELTEAFGWVIVHSFWQATLVAIVLAIILFILRKKSAQLKYFLAFSALIGILVWSAVTFVQSYNYAVEKQAIKEQIIHNPDYIRSLIAPTIQDESTKVVSGDEKPFDLRIIKLRAFFQRNFGFICAIWFIGMFFLVFRLAIGFMYARRLRSYHLAEIPAEWLLTVHEVSERLGIKRKVEAFFSPLANVPLSLGAIKPIILFPVTAFSGLSSKEIEAVIAHELAHVLRHDYLFNIIQSMVEILFFYHPAVWVISSQIRAERENSCDNIAISTTGDKLSYVKALASVQVQQQSKKTQLSMAFSSRRGSVLQRIKRLQNDIAMKTNFIEGLIAAGVILVSLTLASFSSGNKNTYPSVQGGRDTTAVAPVCRTQAEKDSIKAVLEAKVEKAKENNNETDELDKAVEVALSENDGEVSADLSEEINRAIDEVNVDEIVRSAMQEAVVAMREASVSVKEAADEIDHEGINRDMEEAMHDIEKAKSEVAEDMRRDMEKDGVDKDVIEASINAATAGLDVAASVVGNIDVEGIVSSALNGVSAALSSVGQVTDKPCSIKNDDDHAQDVSHDKMKDLEHEKKKLQKEQEKLQKKVDSLQKKIERIEKEKAQ